MVAQKQNRNTRKTNWNKLTYFGS